MPSKNSTPSQKPRKLAAQASWHLIAKWAETICMGGDEPEAKTAAFLLLMDEVERAQFDRLRIEGICFEARRAAFAVSDEAYKAQQDYVNTLREKNKLSLVPAKAVNG